MENENAYLLNMGYDTSLSKIAGGDKTELSQLYLCLKKPVFLLALSILRDYALAEDVMQETFVKINEKAGTYTKGTNPKAWALTITRNLALNCLKKRNHEELNYDDMNEKANDSEQSIASGVEFTQALAQLDELERSIVTLHLICGLKHSQTAKIVDLSCGDVRARYCRSLKKLKKYYEETEARKG